MIAIQRARMARRQHAQGSNRLETLRNRHPEGRHTQFVDPSTGHGSFNRRTGTDRSCLASGR